MKNDVKVFLKKQNNVIRRHKPSSIVSHSLNPVVDFSLFNNDFFDVDTLRKACSVEVKDDSKKQPSY